ncbi:MAG: HEAT repeat domain-containing protein, partial [Calditrichia bacterium]
RQDYFRVKNLLVDLLQNSEEDTEIREVALKALSGLGFQQFVREWINDFFTSDKKSSRIIAVLAMGKYPHFWEEELAALIMPDTDKILLMEAISACYSSESELLASKIVKVLEMADADADVMVYALYTLANINRTENLGELLQKYSLHSERRVREAARKAIDLFSQKNFDDFLHNDLGYEE